MDLENFINHHEVYFAEDRIDETQIPSIEAAIGISFGQQLKSYLLRYGYLLFSGVEFYGVNIKTVNHSDLVQQTNYLHKYFPKTWNLIAVENQGEGHYVLVDSHDSVSDYRSETDELMQTGMTFFQHILCRFQEAQTM